MPEQNEFQNGESELKDTGASLFFTQRDRVVQNASLIANLLHECANRMRDNQSPYLATCADALGNRTDRLAATLHGLELNTIVDSAVELSSRRPGLVAGGLFVLGALAGRVLKDAESDILQGLKRASRTHSKMDTSLAPTRAEVH